MTDVPTKVCTGPAHPGPTRVPVTKEHWNFHRSGPDAGKPTSRCKLCTNWAKLVTKEGAHGLVERQDVLVFLNELIERCGSVEQVQTRHGLNANGLRAFLSNPDARMQKRTLARVLVALGEQRKLDRRNGTSPRFHAARRAQADREGRLERLIGY